MLIFACQTIRRHGSRSKLRNIPPARAASYGPPQGRMHLHLHLPRASGRYYGRPEICGCCTTDGELRTAFPFSLRGVRPRCSRVRLAVVVLPPKAVFARAVGPHVAADAVTFAETPEVERTDCEVQRGEVRAHLPRAVGLARVARGCPTGSCRGSRIRRRELTKSRVVRGVDPMAAAESEVCQVKRSVCPISVN